MKLLLFLTLTISFLPAAKRPNVLLILADDLGYSDLSCYGGEIPTPNLDRLAAGGVRFSDFYTSARCCPSRASLLTGLHPHQAGVGSFAHSQQPPGKGLAYKGSLLPTCATLAEMLRDQGYSTWMVGKWHLSKPGPIERGFENYYGYRNLLAHSEDQWNPANYLRLPEEVPAELPVREDFYVTDVFTDYSLEFLRQARTGKDRPWFLYLAHSSPHFPIQAPPESIERHLPIYRRGWDVLRRERFDNTLIVFLSDNEACYEWGSFGFDGPSRLGRTILHEGEELTGMGQAGTHSSYGSAWANLGNTPLNMYKHFCHEGGLASPLIFHWPQGIAKGDGYLDTPAHLMDLVPTILEATGASYPKERGGHKITPVEGISLLPAIGNPEAVPERVLAFEHQGARGLRKGDWKLVWGKRQPDQVRWELFDLSKDRSEQRDLAATYPATRDELINDWNAWARRVQAAPFLVPEPGYQPTKAPAETSSPPIAQRPFTIKATIKGSRLEGVVLAQGGKEQGYALHFLKGVPHLDIRVNGKVTRLSAPGPVYWKVKLEGKLTAKRMFLTVNGRTTSRESPGLIPVQPKDPLSLGQDILTAAGDYDLPHSFQGEIRAHRVVPDKD